MSEERIGTKKIPLRNSPKCFSPQQLKGRKKRHYYPPRWGAWGERATVAKAPLDHFPAATVKKLHTHTHMRVTSVYKWGFYLIDVCVCVTPPNQLTIRPFCLSSSRKKKKKTMIVIFFVSLFAGENTHKIILHTIIKKKS